MGTLAADLLKPANRLVTGSGWWSRSVPDHLGGLIDNNGLSIKRPHGGQSDNRHLTDSGGGSLITLLTAGLGPTGNRAITVTGGLLRIAG